VAQYRDGLWKATIPQAEDRDNDRDNDQPAPDGLIPVFRRRFTAKERFSMVSIINGGVP